MENDCKCQSIRTDHLERERPRFTFFQLNIMTLTQSQTRVDVAGQVHGAGSLCVRCIMAQAPASEWPRT